MNVLDLARAELRRLVPYASARDEAEAAAVMLNANESPWPPPGDDGRALNRYPDPQPLPLRRRLATLYGVDAANVLVCRGSDEAIDLLVRGFCSPGRDAIVISPPTFGMYAVCAGVQGAAVVHVPLTSRYELDIDAMVGALRESVKLLFLCSPNNPTGGLVPLAAIERIAAAAAGRSLVIVDEAYIEFADAPSAVELVGRHANLGVLRTLSKAWALAGARVGALLAAAPLVEFLRRIMPPYPLPTPSVSVALEALDEAGERLMRERVAQLCAERDILRLALSSLAGIDEVLPSRANFLTARFADAGNVYRRLLRHGVVVRDVGRYPGLENCLRLSIGTPEENRSLIRLLECAEPSA